MSIGEGSAENDNQLMEVFNVELETECKKFKSNKCPIQIGKNNEYCNFDGLDKFIHAKIKKIDYSKLSFPTLISFAPFFIVVYLLIVVILTKDKACIVLLCLNYFSAFIIQLTTFLKPTVFDSREDFEIYLRKILNCGVKIMMKNDKEIVPFPGEYTTDIIGQIDIPKHINFIMIREMDIFINSNLKAFKKKLKISIKILNFILFINIMIKNLNWKKEYLWLIQIKNIQMLIFLMLFYVYYYFMVLEPCIICILLFINMSK